MRLQNLGYAITAHRAQGLTVDTAHVVVFASTTRENLYVSMTRGRDSNIAYVALDKPDDSHAAPHPDDVTGRTVLYGVLNHSGAELSARQTIEAEQEHWSSIAQLVAEYDTIAAAAQRDRWADLLHNCGLTDEQSQAAITSDAFGPLAAALRRAEATGHDVDRLLPKLAARRGLDDADDIAAVLHHRLNHATKTPAGGRRRKTPALIAGLVPEALGPMSDEMRTSLDQRRDLIENRAHALAEDAVRGREPWLRRLGQAPANPTDREAWLHQVVVIAAYRDRYQITARAALGPGAASEAQRFDEARAKTAMRHAADIARHADEKATRGPVGVDGPTIRS